jgi:hypothetical protein
MTNSGAVTIRPLWRQNAGNEGISNQSLPLARKPEAPIKVVRSAARQTVKFLEISLMVITLGIVVGMMLWLKSPALDGSPTAHSMSIQELHMLAHLENLPIQEIDDQSLIYPALAQQTK